jgi:TetR/AcrR family transcriptional regulator, regulator of biofilm formation and stress response
MVSTGRYSRGVERSQQLLDAVVRLIGRVGVAGVTHRAVAQEAGVSLRATTYYFETKDEMIREALRHFVRENISRADAVAQRFPSRSNKLESGVDAIASVMLQEISDPNDVLRTEYELILAISREPRYAPEYQELQRLLDVRLRALLSAMGSADPRRHARIVLAVTRGLQIEHMASPEARPSERSLRANLRALLRALVPSSEHEDF